MKVLSVTAQSSAKSLWIGCLFQCLCVFLTWSLALILFLLTLSFIWTCTAYGSALDKGSICTRSVGRGTSNGGIVDNKRRVSSDLAGEVFDQFRDFHPLESRLHDAEV